MKNSIVIHWFRQDLRLSDNPSLFYAATQGDVLPVYILDDKNATEFKMGAASRWWLHQSLIKLNKALNGNLCILKGDPVQLIPDLVANYQATSVFWNRCYEPWRISRDKILKAALSESGTICSTFNGSLLWEPWSVLKNDQTPYKVFTPFFRRGCLNAAPPREPLPVPDNMVIMSNKTSNQSKPGLGINLTELRLMPKKNWYDHLASIWNPGEVAANINLQSFLNEGISNYKAGRNFPSRKNVSRLSSYLHWGEISPNQIWYSTKDLANNNKLNLLTEDKNIDHFLSEIGWREFANSLLYHFPGLPRQNLQKRFDNFPWRTDELSLTKWQKGLTGFPIVDAGMRELWKTGYMHNRLRMIVGSFLVKNLLIHWKHGESWFWNTLVDADLANNSAGWQWIAGCGADAAPYFRVFNPIIQGQKFDPDGIYIREFIPELKKLPNKYIFAPWEAPKNILKDSGVILEDNYPNPICDIKLSREAALEAFKQTKSFS